MASKEHCQRQSHLLPNVSAGLVNQRQSVGVRVEDKTNVGAVLRNERANVLEVGGNRLRLMEEIAVRVAGMANRSGLKCFQEPSSQRSPCPAVGIQEYAQSPRANPNHVHQF